MKLGKIIDLSMAIEENMRVFPGLPQPSLAKVKTHDQNGLQATRLEAIVHTGTHVDSPCHVLKGGGSISETRLDKLIGEAVVLNLKCKVPGSPITVADLKQYDADVKKNEIVVFNTGYEKYPDPHQYCTLEPGAAHWLVDHEIKCLAVDMPSLDPIQNKNERASSQTHPSHHIILGAGIPLIEFMVNLDSLPKRIFLFCLPLRIMGSDAAPARVIAVEVN